jgi:hypothetical protein
VTVAATGAAARVSKFRIADVAHVAGSVVRPRLPRGAPSPPGPNGVRIDLRNLRSLPHPARVQHAGRKAVSYAPSLERRVGALEAQPSAASVLYYADTRQGSPRHISAADTAKRNDVPGIGNGFIATFNLDGNLLNTLGYATSWKAGSMRSRTVSSPQSADS